MTQPVTKPVLTGDGVRRLNARLKLELKAVQNSSASASLKSDIETRIQALDPVLQGFATDLDAGAPADSWNTIVSPLFQELTPLLAQALAISMDGDTGACQYQGGCIVTTQTLCASIPGIFYPGQPCF